MRTNLPTSNVEYVLKDHETVVSKTDLKGNITFVNADFVAISGFSEEELLGAPQNIVRHPDMPPEAFADMWRNLQAGKAWTGLVKNRCKNGNYYWVEANAAPLIEQGKVIGYTSIRIKPSRERVSAADQAYRAIRNKSAPLHVLNGAVVSGADLRRLKWLGWWTMQGRLALQAGVACAVYALMAVLAAQGGAPQQGALLALAALGGAASLGFMWLLRLRLLDPLRQLQQDIGRMSSGDLSGSIPVQGNDELAGALQALRVLQTNVKLLIGQIKEVTTVVGNGASEIARGNQDLSARTEAQASSLEQTAASMEELTSTVRQNADNAQEVNQMMGAASDVAASGVAAMGQVVATMGAIQDSSRKIVDIIGVIDSIAFQTNILALNAAVEAARAGEQGRGFAVVASEVRNLAQRAATAAKEIKQLIDTSVAEVDKGGSLVQGAQATMSSILGTVGQVAAVVVDISAASREQSLGIEQVNQAVVAMDEVTQQNAALVEESAAAAEQLQRQASHLGGLLDQFRILPRRPQGEQRAAAASAPLRAARPAPPRIA